MEINVEHAIEVMEYLKTQNLQLHSLDTSIEIMRKYQKIAEIYQWAKDRSYLVEADDIMDKLKEVIEDGSN